jgi:outer membrane receptor for monomeric catechols
LWAQKNAAWRATGDTTVINAMNIIQPLLSSFTKDGQHQQGERKYTANLYTNYDFAKESKLAGFSIGGGARYLGPALIGYDDANADSVLETFYGGANTMVDLNVTYRRKLAHNRSLQVQLNVRNLLQEYMVQKVGIVSKAFDQAGGTIVYNTPRQLLLTSTINF